MKKEKIKVVMIFTMLVCIVGLAYTTGEQQKVETTYDTTYSTPYIEPTLKEIPTEEETEVVEKMCPYAPFTEADVNAMAQTIWGEARGCSDYQKWLVAVVILNRYTISYGGATSPLGVVSARGQFVGYSPNHPITDENVAIVIDAIQDWNRHEAGEPQEWYDYLYFNGNGRENVFR